MPPAVAAGQPHACAVLPVVGQGNAGIGHASMNAIEAAGVHPRGWLLFAASRERSPLAARRLGDGLGDFFMPKSN
jgi:hypothetical protein